VTAEMPELSGAVRAPKVVVLNTHYSGIAVGRDLARAGIEVHGLAANPRFPGNRSRTIRYWPSPDSHTDPHGLLAALRRLAAEIGDGAILFPTRDHDINFICDNRDALERSFIVPLAANDVISRALDKGLCAEVARKCGIRVPRQVVVRSRGDIAAAEALRFPCVCKPVRASDWRTKDVWDLVGRRKAVKLDDSKALKDFYLPLESVAPAVVVQEWVEGPDTNLRIFGSYCSKSGEVVAHFTAHKVLQTPPLTGTGVIVRAQPHAEVVDPSAALLRALEFTGLSEIEYKIDDRDGSLNLIEINPRHWDQHGLGTAVGVNLSLAAWCDLSGREVPSFKQSERPVSWIAESEFAYEYLRGIASRSPSRPTLGMLRGVRTFAVWSIADPWPAALMAADWCAGGLGALRQRLGGKKVAKGG
jgi:D-aspartate ligase